jgi:hypothetical protein
MGTAYVLLDHNHEWLAVFGFLMATATFVDIIATQAGLK